MEWASPRRSESVGHLDGLASRYPRPLFAGGRPPTKIAARRITQITTNHISSTIGSGNLISGVLYNPFGEPSSANLYNGVAESWGYDARARMQSYSAKVSSTTKYSLSSVTYSGNSNIRSATDSVNGTWSAYTYDDFNRLISSSCTSSCPGSGNSLAFSYVYDRYGNRWQQNVTAGSGPQPQYSYDANNRISTSGFTFDAAGNIINDGVHSYTYDAENRIIKVDTGLYPVYSYDAEGRRVAKSAAGIQYEYLFDLAGRPVTEIQAGTTSTNRTEVYAGGRHLATQNVGLGTSYFIHADWLGTERARTDLSGNVTETCTSLAYGDSLTCTGTDVSPLHFTGKMHDTETGLDEFPARYYSSTQGRWYSPDWASAQVPVPYADLHNPQTLNLYDYVGSDPTNHADADGHINAPGQEANNACAGNQQCAENKQADAQAQTAAQNTSQPAPTNPDGSPKAPPTTDNKGNPIVPGVEGWKPGPGSAGGDRDTRWGPTKPVPADPSKGQGQPNASWDPAGHWDVKTGNKGETVRILPDGTRVDHNNDPIPMSSSSGSSVVNFVREHPVAVGVGFAVVGGAAILLTGGGAGPAVGALAFAF